jgi:hypothetical protein
LILQSRDVAAPVVQFKKSFGAFSSEKERLIFRERAKNPGVSTGVLPS